MPLESVTYISDLNVSNPVSASDPVSQGDDHLRNIKLALRQTFPNVTGAVSATHTELNYVAGATGTTGTGNLVRSASPTFTGTVLAAALTASGAITAASFAGAGASLTGLSASNLASGTVPDARFPATLPALSGANLTTLNASNLASGTVPDARFPATLPALNGSALTALNASVLASGTVPDARFPATLPALSGANLTALNASNIASGTLAAARYVETGSFTGTLTGFVANPTGTVSYVKVGRLVTLYITADMTSVSNLATMTMTGLPSAVQPSSAKTCTTQVTSASQDNFGGLASINGSTITFYCMSTSQYATNGFSTSNTKGLKAGWTIHYAVDS